jgi:ABC-2 type transport system ATP-binding protein
VFLDEPTTGLDPAARHVAWELVLGLRELGKTIILTTHYMEEAERLADRIAVISHGEIVATGTPQTLGARELMDASISFTLPVGVVFDDLPAPLEAAAPSADPIVRVRAADPVSSLLALTRWAVEHDISLPDLEVRRPSLEDIYLQITDAPEEAHQ